MHAITKHTACTHLDNHSVINRSQNGFVKHKSCQTNLNSVFDWDTSLLDGGYAVDVIYLNFPKASDKVPPDILISKLRKCRIDDVIFRWICNRLDNRTQSRELGGSRKGMLEK